MGTWGWKGVVCLLMVGCGGPMLDEAGPPEAPVSSEAEALQTEWRPERNGARFVKDLFANVDAPPWWGPAPESPVAFKGRLYFTVSDGESPERPVGLWMSDGREGGTVAVKEFPTYRVGPLTLAAGRLLFQADDGVHGHELWSSDGTPAGTVLVKDLTPGAEGSHLERLGVTRRGLLFLRLLPEPSGATRAELWRSDGTPAGTVRVRDLGTQVSESYGVYGATVVGDTVLFFDSIRDAGLRLWKSDGTPAGTVMVKNLFPHSQDVYVREPQVVGRTAYFVLTEVGRGQEVWRTDGTAAGTRRAESTWRVPEGEYLHLLKPLGGSVYFTTSSMADRKMRLYRLKGGCSGSSCVERVASLPNPYADREFADPYITTSAVAGSKLFFGMAISSSGPAPLDVQLWVTDGTRSGTRLVHRPLSLSDEFGSEISPVGSRVLFTGGEEYGSNLEPWVSDGTERGTWRLQEIAPGPASSYAYGFTRVGESVFFIANDRTHGNELWFVPLVP